jgi:hypothetical protein
LNYFWLHVWRRFGLQLNQTHRDQANSSDYVMTQIDSTKGFGSHQNDVRYSGGVVLRFGERQ